MSSTVLATVHTEPATEPIPTMRTDVDE